MFGGIVKSGASLRDGQGGNLEPPTEHAASRVMDQTGRVPGQVNQAGAGSANLSAGGKQLLEGLLVALVLLAVAPLALPNWNVEAPALLGETTAIESPAPVNDSAASTGGSCPPPSAPRSPSWRRGRSY